MPHPWRACGIATQTGNHVTTEPLPSSSGQEPIPPRIRQLVLGGIVLMTITALIARAATPYLLVNQPLGLIALNPDASLMVLVAPQVDLGALIAVAAPRRILNMSLTFGLGALYGPMAITWAKEKYPRLARLIDVLDRLFARHGALVVLFLPVYSICGLAGALRIPFWRFLLAITPGQVLWAVGTYYLGGSLSAWINPFISWLSGHVGEATAVCIVAVVLYQLLSRRRGKGDEGPPT